MKLWRLLPEQPLIVDESGNYVGNGMNKIDALNIIQSHNNEVKDNREADCVCGRLGCWHERRVR